MGDGYFGVVTSMRSSPDYFWSKVDRRSDLECWPWVGRSRAKNGYGRLDIWGEEGVYANRVAYLIAHPGSISLRAPKSKETPEFVLHTCDSPSCCNPAHLMVGTHAENMRHKVGRGRSPDFSGDKGPRCKLTSEDVRDIRRMKKSGATGPALELLYEVSKATISGVLYGRHYVGIV